MGFAKLSTFTGNLLIILVLLVSMIFIVVGANHDTSDSKSTVPSVFMGVGFLGFFVSFAMILTFSMNGK